MSSKCVLVVDTDDKFIDDLNEFFFKEAGINNILLASSVKEGLEKIKKFKPAIVLLDFFPSDINSLDAVKIITGLSAASRVLIVSDVYNADYCNAAFEAGADAFIDKKNFRKDLNLILNAIPKNIEFLFEKYLLSKN